MAVKITVDNIEQLHSGNIIIKFPLQGSVKNDLELDDVNNYISYIIDNIVDSHKNKFKLSLKNKHFKPRFNSSVYPVMHQANTDELTNGYWWIKE